MTIARLFLALGFWQIRRFGCFYHYEKIAKACQRTDALSEFPQWVLLVCGEVFPG
jgi:hypothetical protein